MRKERKTDMQQKYALVASSIAFMWLAVLFVGVFGPDITNESAVAGVTTRDALPSVVIVAPATMIATAVVGWFGFRQ